MRRDFELVRTILLELEKHESSYLPCHLKVEGWTEQEVALPPAKAC